METEARKLLESVKRGETSVDEALMKLKTAPFEDIGYAKLDTHRKLRTGAAEVIYGAGKTPEQIAGIITKLRESGQERILVTRLSEQSYETVSETEPLTYHKAARIGIVGDITDLKHEDYRGKRVYVSVKDDSLHLPLRTKIDIGVHTHDEMTQVEYGFDVVTAPEKAELQANSNEQMFVEKLASLLRHGALSNRPKDIFDMYYLSSRVRLKVVRRYVSMLVYSSRRCPIADKRGMVDSLRRTFGSARYMRKLASARINWLGVLPRVATAAILRIAESL